MSTVSREALVRLWFTWEDIPPSILSRIADADIHSPDEWRRSGCRRYEIFGVTPVMTAQIDRIVAGYLL
jgi:hypothetical protein